MVAGLKTQEVMQENHLRKQLAVAVRSIQWSYAIFWSISTKQQGMLEWGDGYYNGDIKTRKTMEPMEVNVEKLGLKRSEQLRELYDCLAIGETNQQAKRPSAALSPEDLSDAEWYYLVCMSFTFSPGAGLPGRALANGQHIWLCNANYADSKIFSRSLLAKSASIQTVVCFPLLGGVIELGVTELVLEDSNLLQHIKTVFLEFPKLICSGKTISSPRNDDNDKDPVCEIDHDLVDTMGLENLNPMVECGMQPEVGTQVFPYSIPPYIPKEDIEFDQNGINELHTNLCEELRADSPYDSSNGDETNQQTEDSFMMEGVNGVASQVQSWQFMDDDLSNCVHGSMNSSDCISQTFFNPEKLVSPQKREKVNNLRLRDLQECNHTKFNSLDLGTDDLHYTKTLSVILKNSNSLIVAPCSGSGNHNSSFAIWKKGSLVIAHKPQIGTPQKMLKKILFDVALMHSESSMSRKKNGRSKPEGEDIGVSHFSLERNEKLNDQFIALRSLVPSISKFDKASVLGDTIEYLKDLERRVEELESCRELTEFESRGRKKHPDIAERTSDNYGKDELANGKRTLINKRKASDIDEMNPELDWTSSRDGLAADVTVSVIEKDVSIEVHIPWRECLLLEIMDVVTNLQLDAHSVQSSTSDGVLSLSLKSKFRGVGLVSAGMIKLAIQRVVATDTS